MLNPALARIEVQKEEQELLSTHAARAVGDVGHTATLAVAFVQVRPLPGCPLGEVKQPLAHQVVVKEAPPGPVRTCTAGS